MKYYCLLLFCFYYNLIHAVDITVKYNNKTTIFNVEKNASLADLKKLLTDKHPHIVGKKIKNAYFFVENMQNHETKNNLIEFTLCVDSLNFEHIIIEKKCVVLFCENAKINNLKMRKLLKIE